MELTHNTKVEFEPITHSYSCGDILLKGVTTLMKENGLSADYSGVSDEVLAEAAAKGTALHKLLEDYDNGKAVALDEETKDYPKLGLNVLASEYLVSDNMTVATMIDKVIYVDEQTVDLADVKRTYTFHEDAVAWQLSICKFLFELQNPTIKVRNLYGIHFKDKKCKLILVNEVKAEEVEYLLSCNEQGIPYMPTFSEDEDKSYGSLTVGEMKALTDNLILIEELKQTQKIVEEAVSLAKEKMIQYMQDNNLTELNTKHGKFTLKDSYTKSSIDTKALKAKHPKIAKQFTVTSTVKGSLLFKKNR